MRRARKKMAWTKFQKAAIDSRKGNYLVSAGAGSGKTAVLTERIKQIVLDGEKEKEKGTPKEERVGASVNELLVLTFTNKAAAEMKSRIRSSLLKAYQNGELKNDVSSLVESSDITTFDSYFYSLVKKYHYELGIDEDMEIVDSAFFTLKQKQIIDEIFLSHYERKDENFLALFPIFKCIKDDKNISDMVENVLSVASQTVDPIAFMKSLSTDFLTDEYFEKRKAEWGDCLEKEIRFIEENVEKKIESKELADYLLAHTSSVRDIVHRGCSQSEAAEYQKTMNRDYHFRTEDGKNQKYTIVSEFDFNAGQELKDRIKEILDVIKATAPFETAEAMQKSLKPHMETISSLSIEIYEALNKFKKEYNVYDFADIAAMAREILDDPEIRQSIASSYKYVMVDEYQDTSDLQEDFLLKVTNDNLFAVGDIKQSIYRFRNANPKIFGDKFDAYKVKEGGNLITLNSNFRSARNVIDDMNSFFGETMSLGMGGIEYDENQKMIFGNVDLYGPSTKAEYATEKIVYEKKKLAADNTEEEARLVALDILSKVGKYQVFDGETRELRPARFEDFVILSRGKKCFQTFVRVFSDYKIPLLTSDKKDLSGEDVSLLFKRFLRFSLVIDGGKKEEEEIKHSYASIMRSYLYRKKDSEIVSELEDGSYMESDFFVSFKKLNKELSKLPPSLAVEKLLSVYPFFDKLPTIGHLVDNYENISFFRKTAKTCERLRMDYKQFCSFFVDLDKKKISPSLDAPAESKGAARIMTIHASKGLEFPVVYIVSNDSEFNGKIPNISKNYGILLDFADSSVGENPLKALMKNEETKESKDEEVRILYVAFTRAKQKLIIVKSEGKNAEFYPMVSSYLALEEKNKKGMPVIDWSLKTLDSYGDFYNVSETFAKFGKLSVLSLEEGASKAGSISKREDIVAPMLKTIDYKPEKIIKARASKNEAMKLEDYSKVAYGLRMHRILECVSFVKKDVSFLLEGYEKRKISAILAHPLWNDMDNAKEFHEYSFYDEAQGIHGSIDLLIVKEDVCQIIDFKSHKVDDPAYRKQLGAYKAYVERVFGKKARTYLLSIADASITEIE